MDCCSDKSRKDSCTEEIKNWDVDIMKKMKGGIRKMDRRITLWIVIGAMFVLTLFLTFKAGAVGGSVGNIGATTTSVKSAVASSGMVGGC